jgi:phage tail-like protein
MVRGLATPYPLHALLPSVLQEDPMAVLLTEGLDEVLAPVIATLDCVHAYLDPMLAPPDFLEWVAGWVGAELDENWPLARQRDFVRTAVELYRTRGTVDGLRQHVALVTGGPVDVVDAGGVVWSTTPDAAFPDNEPPSVTVLLDGAGADGVAAVAALVTAAKPAHVSHSVRST